VSRATTFAPASCATSRRFSPLLFGVSRATALCLVASVHLLVSVPFSSGCRARQPGLWPRPGPRAVSVPFSSGCRARRCPGFLGVGRSQFQSPSLRGVARDGGMATSRSRMCVFQSPSLRGVARDNSGWFELESNWAVSVPFSSGCRARPSASSNMPPCQSEFQSPSLRGVARDAGRQAESCRPLRFQSPSLRGVARDVIGEAITLTFSPVSVPFSSGCRARPSHEPEDEYRDLVSVPFSSGCRARRSQSVAITRRADVSVPFSSGCRARLCLPATIRSRTTVSVPFSSGCRARQCKSAYPQTSSWVSVPFSSGCRARLRSRSTW